MLTLRLQVFFAGN